MGKKIFLGGEEGKNVKNAHKKLPFLCSDMPTLKVSKLYSTTVFLTKKLYF